MIGETRPQFNTHIRDERRLRLLIFKRVPVDCRHPRMIADVVNVELFVTAEAGLGVAVEKLTENTTSDIALTGR